MKIAQVCPRFLPHIGGVETHVYEISKRLVEEFDVEVLTTDPTGKLAKIEEIGGFTVRRFKSLAPSDSYYLSPSLHWYLKRTSGEYNIIHAHSYHAFPALHAAMTKKENKLIFTPHYHGKGHSLIRNLLHKPYKPLGSKIFDKADAIICVSEYEKNLVLKNFNVDGSIVHLIPNGVNLDEFKDIEKIKKSKDSSKKVILYVGRLEKYKGLDYVVEALARLDSEFILEIVGKGPYKQNIVRLANRLGVLNRIRFYQNLSRRELIEKYAKADVLVLLSKHEAYGLAVAEALAAKTPCIVANEAALTEWIDDRNVFGVDHPVNVCHLVRLIEDVVSREVSKVDKLKSWDEVAKEVRRVYLKLSLT
ncbi:glycosyltransferase family 4 protein [Archaeoglobus veneficus]|uniref:Glycosyl transferase group 1 n=1 Tax=Archaeoglobus veneficus (strain DSM 11195 / SNP6) TaxID=693661 RepID=F2KQM7_ARCVS|nr:glycosyltransferase family 4 protein [Archaeoglobus veneficus]AEA46589.1 glycosyl transferase group 1 [Archaeoglobus veneficus SNP6]